MSAPLWYVVCRHFLRVHPPQRIHLSVRANVRGKQRQVLEHHPPFPLAPTIHQRRGTHLCRRRSVCSTIGDGKGNRLHEHIRRESFGAHEHLHEVTRDPLGLGVDTLVVVTVPRTKWGRAAAAFFWSSSRFARFFEARLSFARRIYAQGGGVVEGGA